MKKFILLGFPICAAFLLTLPTVSAKNSYIAKAAVENPAITISDDFKTTAVNSSNVYSSSNIVNTANASHPGIPGKAWGGSIDYTSGNLVGYFVYKVESTEGKVINELELDYNAQIWHVSKAGLVNSYINVYGSTDGTNWGTAVDSQKAGSTSGFKNYNVKFNITNSYLATYYIKIEEVIDPNFTSDFTDGKIGLSYIPTKLATTSITASLQDKPAAGEEFDLTPITDDFKTTAVNSSNVYSSSNIVNTANASHPGIPGKAWGGDIDYTSGNLIGSFVYKVDAGSTNKLTSLKLDYNAKICYLSKAGLVNSYINVYGSTDGTNWGTAVDSQKATDTNTFKDYSVSFDFSGKVASCYYIKIEEVIDSNFTSDFPTGKIGLNYIPTKLATTSITGKYSQLTDLDYVSKFVQDFMHMNEEVEGQCLTLYGPAKEALSSLTNSQRIILFTQPSFASVCARLQAWAIANGETLTILESGVLDIAQGKQIMFNTPNNSLVIISVVLISVFAFAITLFVRNKIKKSK